jgi:RNA polymerase sigma factor (sigma-70 family)
MLGMQYEPELPSVDKATRLVGVDVEEFTAFCLSVHGRLAGAVMLYCGDRTLAEDITQEALARAWRDWAQVRAKDSREAWVFRTAFNLTNSWHRRMTIARLRAPLLISDGSVQPDVASALAIRAAVRSLPARQREAIVLRFYADLSVADTAAAMRCAEGTVRALTAQAVAALRTTIDHDDRETSDER